MPEETNYEKTFSKVNNREGAKERYAKFLERHLVPTASHLSDTTG